MQQADIKSPALMLRQLWLLAAFAGIFATRHPYPAFASLLLLLVLEKKRWSCNGRSFGVFFLLGLSFSFMAGFYYTNFRAEPLPARPGWIQRATAPTVHHLLLEEKTGASSHPKDIWEAADNRFFDSSSGIEPDGVYRKGIRLRARVESSEGRVDRNLRLILKDIHPVDDAATFWPGKLAFTWYKPLTPEGMKPDPPDTLVYLRRKTDEFAELLPQRPLTGQEVELHLRLREIRSLSNPGLWQLESYWADQGVGLRAWESGERPELELHEGRGWAFKTAMLREGWRQKVLDALPKERSLFQSPDDKLPDEPQNSYAQSGGMENMISSGAELIPALLFGDKYLLDSRDSELFARSTLAHSLALSGLHLGYAAALGYFAVSLLYRFFPRLCLRLPRKKAAVLGGAVPALAYLWIGGAPPSLLRAAMMLVFIGWSMFRSRPLVLADALLWAVGVILLWNPLALFDLRLQLSALCIAALAWAQPAFGTINRALVPSGGSWPRLQAAKMLKATALLLLSSFVIQLALAPLLVKTFGLFGLAMPLNALWLPVLGLMVMPCAFLGLFCVIFNLPALAGVFFQLAVLPCGWLLEFLRWLDASGGLPALLPMRPHWLAMLAYWFLLALLPQTISSCKNRKPLPGLLPKLALALLLLVSPGIVQLYENSHAQVKLRLLDVGQGQAILLEWHGKRLLLDGGGGANPRFDIGREVVAATLTEGRLPQIDYMLASHLDQDHAQGLLFPLKHFKVGYYADNGEPSRNRLTEEIFSRLRAQGLERKTLLAGDMLDLGHGLCAEVLHPAAPPASGGKEGNRNSLVIRFTWQGKGLAIACGDVDTVAQRAILRRAMDEGRDLNADVLILPHHGSAGSLLPAFYKAVDPRLALAATGYGNIWNFPPPRVKNTLLELGIPLLNTARCGQLAVTWRDNGTLGEVRAARWGSLHVDLPGEGP